MLALVASAGAASLLASRKGQNPATWFLLGLIFPVAAPIIALAIRPSQSPEPIPTSVEEAALCSPVLEAVIAEGPIPTVRLLGRLADDNAEIRGIRDLERRLGVLEEYGYVEECEDQVWRATDQKT
jgi:hypothetical protein